MSVQNCLYLPLVDFLGKLFKIVRNVPYRKYWKNYMLHKNLSYRFESSTVVTMTYLFVMACLFPDMTNELHFSSGSTACVLQEARNTWNRHHFIVGLVLLISVCFTFIFCLSNYLSLSVYTCISSTSFSSYIYPFRRPPFSLTSRYNEFPIYL